MDGFKQVSLALATAGALVSGVAQAALHDRGGGLIYDDVLKITWLSDANYSATQYAATGGAQGDADGLMSWAAATSWAANLVYGKYDNWRLPTVIDTGTSGCDFTNGGTDCGFNVQTVDTSTNPYTVYSELAHMYHNNLGFKSYFSPIGVYQPDFGIFGNGSLGGERDDLGPNGAIDNLQSHSYWSGTVALTYLPPAAWRFDTNGGGQVGGHQSDEIFAWAVRDGDVPPIPEPETYAMMLAGLGLLGVMARRRKQKLNA